MIERFVYPVVLAVFAATIMLAFILVDRHAQPTHRPPPDLEAAFATRSAVANNITVANNNINMIDANARVALALNTTAADAAIGIVDVFKIDHVMAGGDWFDETSLCTSPGTVAMAICDAGYAPARETIHCVPGAEPMGIRVIPPNTCVELTYVHDFWMFDDELAQEMPAGMKLKHDNSGGLTTIVWSSKEDKYDVCDVCKPTPGHECNRAIVHDAKQHHTVVIPCDGLPRIVSDLFPLGGTP